MTNARRHLIYYYFLSECLLLKERDAQEVARVWGVSKEEAEEMLIRSAPSETFEIIVMPSLVNAFDYDLFGVPGFFYDYKRRVPFNWQLNLKRSGLLRPYTDERGRIIGIYVYQSAYDTRPRLLSSEGLLFGTQAIQPLEQAA
jgi:hypothetical protein